MIFWLSNANFGPIWVKVKQFEAWHYIYWHNVIYMPKELSRLWFSAKYSEDNNNQTGIHSIINLERCIFPFIIKYYLPCIAIITMSLVSFLLTLEHIPVRVMILVTNFLTLTNILIAQQVNFQKRVLEW